MTTAAIDDAIGAYEMEVSRLRRENDSLRRENATVREYNEGLTQIVARFHLLGPLAVEYATARDAAGVAVKANIERAKSFGSSPGSYNTHVSVIDAVRDWKTVSSTLAEAVTKLLGGG